MFCDHRNEKGEQTDCPIWCLRRIDRELVAAGWPAISPWWWNVFENCSGVRNVVVRGGRRGGKSTTICKKSVSEVLNPKHAVPPGDVGYFAIVSATKEQAKERLNTCSKILDVLGVPHRKTAEQIIIESDTRQVGIKCFAATLKGVVSFTSIGALCDEEARWQDPDTGANPAGEVLGSLRPTMATMPNAQMWHVSSPWSTLDVHHKMVEEGDTIAQRVFCGSTWEMNPTLTEADTHALEPDYPTWLREYAAQPMSSDETKFFPAEFIDNAARTIADVAANMVEFFALHRWRHGELQKPVERVAGGADFAFRRNSSALIVFEKRGDLLCLTAGEERIPGNTALVPSRTIKELAGIAVERGADSLACDLHYIESVREHVDDLEIGLLEFPTSPDKIGKAYVRTRVLLSEGKIDLTGAPPRLLEQLKETTSKPTDGAGLTIKNKKAGDAHGDLVSALVCAVWAFDQELPAEKFGTGERRYGRHVASNGDTLTDLPPEEWN
jgi:hypothetical protein